MQIHLLFITYNRLEYTIKSLNSILKDKNEEFTLTIWDNASTDGTREYLKTIKDHRVDNIVLSRKNYGQIDAINTIWNSSRADLLGKLDNDCLVTPGWTRILTKAHEDVDNLGAIACWHFFEDDFNISKSRHKIQEFNGHKILRHPWICGTGFLVKRKSFLNTGLFYGKTTTNYWMKMAESGMINGFYYPLVYQEHMDDPKSCHSNLRDEESYQEARKISVSLDLLGQRSLEDKWNGRRQIINTLLCDPWEVKYYVGWRGFIRRIRKSWDVFRRRNN